VEVLDGDGQAYEYAADRSGARIPGMKERENHDDTY
jgi:hypothetical protein